MVLKHIHHRWFDWCPVFIHIRFIQQLEGEIGATALRAAGLYSLINKEIQDVLYSDNHVSLSHFRFHSISLR